MTTGDLAAKPAAKAKAAESSLGIRNNSADKPEPKGLFCIECSSREEEFEGTMAADNPRQMREMDGWDYSDVNFRIAESRVLAC